MPADSEFSLPANTEQLDEQPARQNVALQDVLAGTETLISEQRAAVAEKLTSYSRSRWFSEGDVGKA